MPDRSPTTLEFTALPLEPGTPLVFERNIWLPPIRLAGQDYIFVPGVVSAVVKVIDVRRGYTVAMAFSCRLEGACWRCLEPAHLDMEVSVEDFFAAELPPLEQIGEEDEPALWYEEDGILNLSEWARDAIAELLPPKILCRPECKGLCPQCGADLNLVQCGCEPPADFRWDKLRDWKPE